MSGPIVGRVVSRVVGTVLQSSAGEEADGTLFLGEDLLVYLVLAFGGALFVGNIAALVRPPAPRPGDDGGDGEPHRAPVGRSLVMAGLGLIGAVWALASLVAG